MTSLTTPGEFDDVLNDSYLTASVAVGTSAVEAKVGASRLTDRESLVLHNLGGKTVYVGPSGVTASTGVPLFKNQTMSMPAGDAIGVFLICGTGDSADVIVQELG